MPPACEQRLANFRCYSNSGQRRVILHRDIINTKKISAVAAISTIALVKRIA
jgi:hypothetical protein